MPPSPKAHSWLPTRRLRGARGPFGPAPNGPEPQTNAPLFAPYGRRPPSGRLPIPNKVWWWAAGLLFAGGAGVLLLALALADGVKGSLADNAPASPHEGPQAGLAGPSSAPRRAVAGPQATVTVLLSADGAIGEHHLFWLEQPKRLVVDLMGVGEAVAAPIVAPKHPLLRRVRWGRHDDRVRFVLEVAPQVHDDVRVRPDGASLAVTLHALEAAHE